MKRWMFDLFSIVFFCVFSVFLLTLPGLLSKGREYASGTFSARAFPWSNEGGEAYDADGLYESADIKLLAVPRLCQYPSLPTGCESTAAAMVLQYYGEDISAEAFAGEWLRCDDDFYMVGDVLYGPDPQEAFAGDPFSAHAFGCFAGPVAAAVNENSVSCHAEVLYDETLSSLCKSGIDRQIPVLIFATMEMRPVAEGRTWRLPDGTDFIWPAGEHCLVLVGYDNENYYFNDPRTGGTEPYPKEIAEERFAELGRQAVVIADNQTKF